MSNEPPRKGLRDQLGDGYVNLLDSVRHSFEQAAWGQEASGSLADDFYRWVGSAEDVPKAIDGAELAGGTEARAESAEPYAPSERDWKEFEAWIDGKIEAQHERHSEAERERNGPELGE